ncbi:MAG: EamA/RhaT family transporter, partial [Oscillospiraceae bacterium]|nr:EamA/RhaT family transporter [Oscillospiraceae bacterium]
SLVLGERAENFISVVAVLAVGCIAYGFSIFVYVYAQRILGAARTSAYYAVSPFIGTALSLAVFRVLSGTQYFAALLLMMIGAWLSSCDEPLFKKKKA